MKCPECNSELEQWRNSGLFEAYHCSNADCRLDLIQVVYTD